MRFIRTFLWVAAAGAFAVGSHAIGPGSGAAAVRDELGAPSGRMELEGGREIWIYERGRVEFLTGTVARVDLITPEQLQVRRQADADEARRRMAVDASRRAALKAEGEAVLQRWLVDPDFLLAAPEWQLEKWKEFTDRYPDVCVTQHVVAAVERVREARDQSVRDSRMKDLEFRVWSAEQKAAAAEAKADARTAFYPAYSYWPDGRMTYRVAPWYVAPGTWPDGSLSGSGATLPGSSGTGIPGMRPSAGPGGGNRMTPGSWPYNFSRGMSGPGDAARHDGPRRDESQAVPRPRSW